MTESPRAAPRPDRTRLAAFLLAALLAAVLGALWARGLPGRDARPQTTVAAVFDAPRALPAFALTAHDGSRFDERRLAGHYSFLFLGFANCPSLCPTTLAELAVARRTLADLVPAERPAVVFISVDPKRDTPEALARYVTHFDPSFVGATGPDAALAPLVAALGATYEIGSATDGSYGVSHTASLFLIDPSGRLRAVFPPPHVAPAIAADYRRIVAAGRRS